MKIPEQLLLSKALGGGLGKTVKGEPRCGPPGSLDLYFMIPAARNASMQRSRPRS